MCVGGGGGGALPGGPQTSTEVRHVLVCLTVTPPPPLRNPVSTTIAKKNMDLCIPEKIHMCVNSSCLELCDCKVIILQ